MVLIKNVVFGVCQSVRKICDELCSVAKHATGLKFDFQIGKGLNGLHFQSENVQIILSHFSTKNVFFALCISLRLRPKHAGSSLFLMASISVDIQMLLDLSI